MADLSVALGVRGPVAARQVVASCKRGPFGLLAGENVVLVAAAASKLTLRELEDRYTEEILRRTGGNKVRAARILGIDRKTLYRRSQRRDDEADPDWPRT